MRPFHPQPIPRPSFCNDSNELNEMGSHEYRWVTTMNSYFGRFKVPRPILKFADSNNKGAEVTSG